MIVDRLARLLPRSVRRALRAPVDVPARLWFRYRLRAADFHLAKDGPVLSYGAALSQSIGALVQGGRVKLTHLDRAFPARADSFNVLYLVSSAIPPHAPELVRFAKERGVKFVWNQNGVAYPAWAGPFTAEVNDPMRALLRAADYVVYQSAFCRASADRLLGRAECPSEVLFNPVDTALFSPAETPPPRTEIRLLAMGTHTYADRVLVTLRCLAELHRTGRAARLTIAGPMQWAGADDEVRRTISALGLREHVALRPAFSQSEAAEMCRAHHVLLHPKYMDPCPTVVIEALACGLPVVGPASGGLPELVDAGSGRLLPVPEDWERMHSPDPVAMSNAVQEIIAAWPAFSAQARHQAAARFAVEPWLERHGEIFRALLAGRQ
ncbi:MAG: glycosyltransferase family 4 protein [Chthoniobacter sp.]|nr:glycosyltransferase family 4 protein [Chthoniobacter sp.]